MSMPAGWYDDGSGRQRWWDGARWTDDFAPVQGAGSAQPAAGMQGAGAPVMSAPAAGSGSAPVLGFVGLGLAVLGTVLACVPVVFGIGVVVLLAAFVVSLIGLFKKNAAKWPSIVGMVISVVGGVIGVIVLVVSLVANVPGPIDTAPGTDAPPSSAEPSESSEPSDPPSDSSEGRPTPAEIAEGFAALAQADGVTTYDDMPEFYPCMGQYFYDSDLSDESLQLIADAQDVTGPERDAAIQATVDGGLICDPQG